MKSHVKSCLLLAGFLVLMAAPAQAAQPLPVEGGAPISTQPGTTDSPATMAEQSGKAVTQLPAGLDPENTWLLDLSTGGRVVIRLRPDIAANHVERIKTLTRRGFYNGQIFHRVIDGFMAQTGDPTGTGQGGSDLPMLTPEFNNAPHVRGVVSMARAESLDSANSQFFIMFQPMLRLDRIYTVFGRVVAGMQWVDQIERGEPPASPSRILQASIAADGLPLPDFPQSKAEADEDLLAREAARLGGMDETEADMTPATADQP